ncbi:MAG TPA: hypothetical protein VFY73_25410, partial [Ideonella sp.]|nr:hypothetical protein [Ideonella sp.]
QQTLPSMNNNAKVDAFNARMNDFTARVKDHQERQFDFDRSGGSGPAADRTRRNLEKEAAALKKEDADLKAEHAQLQTTGAGADDTVAKLNVRVKAQQERADSWNARSKQLVDDQQAYEDERINWLDNCGNRRYKEDDEKAIKAGK